MLVTSFVEILQGISCSYGVFIRLNVMSLCHDISSFFRHLSIVIFNYRYQVPFAIGCIILPIIDRLVC
jgi:hypothetical protein